jgi:MYXO-CTERM domain-containing protein
MFKRLIIITSLLIYSATPSHADTAYRYWGYFQAPAGATSWTAAMTGPSVEVKDGDVEGWTFTASSNDIPATAPMMDPDFSTLCGETSEVAGKVRVGLVVDFGAGEIAPAGETPREFFSDCVVVDAGSLGADVLSAALDIRSDDSGLICGIAGYPSTECGAEIDSTLLVSPAQEVVATTQEAAESSEGGSDSNNFALAWLAALALLVGVFALRRRK